MASIRQDDLGLGRIGKWPLWGRPVLSIWYVLAVDLGALAVIATAFAEPGGADVPVVSGSVHINMVSVWVFAAVLTLPMSWVAVLTGLVSAHVVLRSYGIQRSYPHRQVMNAAAMVLAAWAARLVLDAGGVPVLTRATDLDAVSIGVVLAAAVVFFAVDGVLITISLLVAGAVRRSVRDYDSVGRFGGEEFVVLLPGLRSGDVLAIAERIRRAISQLRVPLPDSDTVLSTLSASIGVAVYPEVASGVDELVHAADTALYRAKRAGRNRVVSSMTVCDTRTG